MNYQEFLATKKKNHVASGFSVKCTNKHLFKFQKFVTERALLHGRYAVFSGTGTGKTRMQVEWAHQVSLHTGKPVLIFAPLAVSGQTIIEAAEIGYKITKASFDINNPHFAPIQIANYDQVENIDCSIFGGVVLDEGSILKNHEGAMRTKLIEIFSDIPYKSVFTATPSPNDPMELGNYAEFLNVMSRNEMLAMYFVHDGGETSKWRLKGHCRKIFWEWVASWAVMFQKPSDIGFDATGYNLPELNLIEKKIITEKRDNGLLFNDVAVNATNFNRELRLTKIERLDEVSDIVNNSKETFIIWVKQNEEGEYLRRAIPGAVEVSGSDANEFKEEKLLGFAKGDFRVLITKTKIAGAGMNFQACHNQIFASLDFSFEALFQGIRRSWRFGQHHKVNIWLITTDTMTNVISSIKQKERQFEEMQAEMVAAMNKTLNNTKKKKMNRVFEEVKTDQFNIQLNDCVKGIKDVPDESIGLSIFSPPFAELYTYSDELEDMGNSKD